MVNGRGRRASRSVPGGRRTLLVGAGVAVAAGAALTVGLWPSGDSGAPSSQRPSGGRTALAPTPSQSPTPSPSRTYPLSKTPRTIPAVREHTPARGPGWRPGKGGRVVVGDDALADEGRLLAGELGLAYAGSGGARAGDVELGLTDEDANAESYTLTVKDGRVRISGTAEAGVFYGTRTLKQGVRQGGTAPEGVVRDSPAKPQRGFMLDIARKHFTAGWIEDRIRELGDLKYNQLGLHFSDDQGFRIASDSHPEVVSKQHLSKAEVRRILALAASRHITVVPEIDSPGHLGAVLDAHPDLQLRNTQGVVSRGSLDISKPASAKIVDDLLNEYAGLFPGRYWHLGADEYRALTVSNPAASYPQLAAAAKAKYGSGAGIADLATGWLNDRAKVVRGHDRTRGPGTTGSSPGAPCRPTTTSRSRTGRARRSARGSRPSICGPGARSSTTTTSTCTTCSGSPTPSSIRPGSVSTSSGPRSSCAGGLRCHGSTTTRSSAATSPSGATCPPRRRRTRWRRGSGCRCGR